MSMSRATQDSGSLDRHIPYAKSDSRNALRCMLTENAACPRRNPWIAAVLQYQPAEAVRNRPIESSGRRRTDKDSMAT